MMDIRSSILAILVLGGAAATPPKHADVSVAEKVIPTFSRDVAPIIYSKCSGCHHPGEVAPFSLMTYEDVKSKAPTIAETVKVKYMPPWQAVSHGEFVNERTLTAQQIQTIRDWAANGAPAGNLTKAPKPPEYTPGWRMGKPDFVGKMQAPYSVSAEGIDEYRCFVIHTDFPEGRYVTGVELRPGNHRVVHHVLVYVDTSGVARKLDGEDGKPGYASFGGPGFNPAGALGGWAPGLEPQILPDGDGFYLPKGADIVLQVHYHKDGKPEVDQTQIGLLFAKKPVDQEVRWEAIANVLLSIPPNDPRYEVKASLTLNAPSTMLDSIPHMHLLGHDMTVTATLPDGTKERVIAVNNYDFNWQTRYTYKHPLHLPKGTRLDLVAHYDNSTNNPHNPNSPPKRVHFGEQTTDEMCFAFFSYTVDSEHLTKGRTAPANAGLGGSAVDLTLTQIFDNFDDDRDGYLSASEIAAAIRFFQDATDGHVGSQTNPDNLAKVVVAMYGKKRKGYVSRAEFRKMVAGMRGRSG